MLQQMRLVCQMHKAILNLGFQLEKYFYLGAGFEPSTSWLNDADYYSVCERSLNTLNTIRITMFLYFVGTSFSALDIVLH